GGCRPTHPRRPGGPSHPRGAAPPDGVVPAERETTAVPNTLTPRAGATAASTQQTGASVTSPFLIHLPRLVAHARFAFLCVSIPGRGERPNSHRRPHGPPATSPTPTPRRPTMPRPDPGAARDKLTRARTELSGALIERDQEVDLVLAALVAREHVLLVGPPG